RRIPVALLRQRAYQPPIPTLSRQGLVLAPLGAGPKPRCIHGRISGDLMAAVARLESLIAPVAVPLGFGLVRVIVTASEAGDGERALQVMAEDPATGQLTLDQCAALSRGVSAVIDPLEEAGEELVEGHYHLEVSSPGIDRPLTRPRDFANWTGHEAKVALAEKADGHRNLRGEIVGIEGD